MKKSMISHSCIEHYNLNEDKGRKNLNNSFANQYLLRNISNIKVIAEKLSTCSEISGYKQGEVIYHQGDFGNDSLFFVLTGSCSLFMNGNFVKEIGKGECFGEFPILDSDTKYSVTVTCSQDKTCIAQVSERQFREIAKSHPEIWENMAKMLAQRLKTSSEEKFKKRPNPKPKIFIGSSSEGLEVAHEIQNELSKDFHPVVWDQGPFDKLNRSFLDCLEEAVNKFDFGIFIFTADDTINIRGENKKITRDNVIFELGMFIGKLTREKAFLVCPIDRELEILSDFKGLITATYDTDYTELRAALGPACNLIRKSINSVYKA